MPLNDGPKRSRDITDMVCFVGQIEIDGLISSFYISTGILYTGIISTCIMHTEIRQFGKMAISL